MRSYKEIQRGYILLLVMVFLQVMASLALNDAMLCANASKGIHGWSRSSAEYVLAMRALLAIETRIELNQDHTICLLATIAPHLIPSKSISWWHNNACLYVYRKKSYHYFLEYLGNDGCSRIYNIYNNQYDAASYYRITLTSQGDEKRFQPIILQSTLAISSGVRLSCENAAHMIHAGRQMVRVLSNSNYDY
jgi:hypothetical protein